MALGRRGNGDNKNTSCERRKDIIGSDRGGAIYNGREANMNSAKQWLAEHTNDTKLIGSMRFV